MAERWRIKKGDKVVVIIGKDKGKTGEVVSVMREKRRVVVKGINIAKRHRRPSAENAGGVVEKELSIHASNVMHVDPETGSPTRIGIKITEKGGKVRFAKASGKVIDK